MNLASVLQRAEQDRPLGRALQPGPSTATAGARGIAVSITVDRKLSGSRTRASPATVSRFGGFSR